MDEIGDHICIKSSKLPRCIEEICYEDSIETKEEKEVD